MGRVTVRRQVTRVTVGQPAIPTSETLDAEEPLELRIAGRTLTVAMRTPGHDMDLLAGFLVGEGIIRHRDDLLTMRYCAGTDAEGHNTYNVLDAQLGPGVPTVSTSIQRSLAAVSGCALTGEARIGEVEESAAYRLRDDPVSIDPAWVATLPERLRDEQRVVDGDNRQPYAALFDIASAELLVLRKDVDRPHAVDKVIGWALREGRLPLRGTVLVASGRASFDLAQRAVGAGVPAVAVVSTATALAAELADRIGLTLIGCLRGPSMVVYAGAARLALAAS